MDVNLPNSIVQIKILLLKVDENIPSKEEFADLQRVIIKKAIMKLIFVKFRK